MQRKRSDKKHIDQIATCKYIRTFIAELNTIKNNITLSTYVYLMLNINTYSMMQDNINYDLSELPFCFHIVFKKNTKWRLDDKIIIPTTITTTTTTTTTINITVIFVCFPTDDVLLVHLQRSDYRIENPRRRVDLVDRGLEVVLQGMLKGQIDWLLIVYPAGIDTSHVDK